MQDHAVAGRMLGVEEVVGAGGESLDQRVHLLFDL